MPSDRAGATHLGVPGRLHRWDAVGLGPRRRDQPVGDLGLLSDLGTPPELLLETCAGEGLLPADVLSTLCERAGCLDTLEQLREG